MTMPILDQQTRDKIAEIFDATLVDPVHMVYFTIPQTGLIVPGRESCETCNDVQTLVEELTELSDKLTLEVHHFERERELAAEYGVQGVPALVLTDQERRGVRFLGAPAGNEFTTLLQDIQFISRHETNLSDETRATLASVEDPIHIQVFVTPT
jgi:alkyl hydroperoxide reductase subunit AhpF